MQEQANQKLRKIKEKIGEKVWSSDKFEPTHHEKVRIDNSYKTKYNHAHRRVKNNSEGYSYVSSLEFHKRKISAKTSSKYSKIALYRRIILDKLFPKLYSGQKQN